MPRPVKRLNDINIYTPTTYPYERLRAIDDLKRNKGNQGTKNRDVYKNIVCAFDIETTAIPAIRQSVMYIWQLAIGQYDVIVGRTWQDLKDTIKELKYVCGDSKLVWYVHNLSYEFQFLKAIEDFTSDTVFAVKSRKVLKCTLADFIELRCSWLHSNMSLDKFTHKMGVKHAKLSGAKFDYTKLRYWYTELTDEELAYCVHDVVGLVEAILTEMKNDGDTLYTIPLTSTGYVRRDAREAMKKVPRNVVTSILPNLEQYEALSEAFRGGNTHANRYFADMIVKDAHSRDIKSSYPAWQVNKKYPMTAFYKMPKKCTAEDVCNLIEKRKRAVLMRVKLQNVELIDRYDGCPYLSKHKCRNLDKNEEWNEYDNGRILRAKYFETTFTDIDFKIFTRQYKYEAIEFIDVWHAKYGRLPQPLLDVTIKYFTDKTELDGVDAYFYNKSKNKLNAIYGMSAQDPVKHNQLFDYTEDTPDYKIFFDDEVEDGELLDKYNQRAFMAYQWGVWITAYAREALQEGIDLVQNTPGAYFLYCDTDSVKYIGNVDWTELNNRRMADSKANGACAYSKLYDKWEYMGVFEAEDDIEQFCTLGAKKYCCVINGKLKATIAGVRKEDDETHVSGATELNKYGGIIAFKEGFVFTESAGLEFVYNDYISDSDKYYVTPDGIKIKITPNSYQYKSTYTISLTGEYRKLLNISQIRC